MKVRSEIITILVCCLSMLISCSEKKGERDSSTGSGSLNNEILNEVSFDKIEITDGFWRPKIDSNRINGIRNVFKECSYSLDNFDIAAGKKDGEHKGTAASDSDVYKIIQGAAYALYHDQDEELEAFIDSLIQSIVDAQQDDGYLFTYWTINDPSMRWKDIERKHELYCAGHMFEAAVAYYQVTGERVLLDGKNGSGKSTFINILL